MTDTLRWIALLLAVYLGLDCGVIAALLWRGSRRRPADPLAYPVGRDATHPLPPMPARSVPPVVAGYTDAERQAIEIIWRDDPTDPAPLRPYRVNWQGEIIERRN